VILFSGNDHHCYGLEFKTNHKNLHLKTNHKNLLAGYIASNPDPESNQNNAFCCLSFNAQSLTSVNKNEDGTVTSNICNFQDLVYSENLDIITITETWLNDTFQIMNYWPQVTTL
jgi:hypothetical protein